MVLCKVRMILGLMLPDRRCLARGAGNPCYPLLTVPLPVSAPRTCENSPIRLLKIVVSVCVFVLCYVWLRLASRPSAVLSFSVRLLMLKARVVTALLNRWP